MVDQLHIFSSIANHKMSENLQLDISNNKINFNNFHIKYSYGYLKIQFNPSKYFTGNNIELVTFDELLNVIDDLQKKLNKLGVEIDLMECGISRIDISKDITPEHKYYCYEDILRSIGFLQKKFKNELMIESSHYFSNKHNKKTILFYDKSLLEKLDYELMRTEIRLTDSRTVFNNLKVSSLNDLVKLGNFDFLEKYFKNQLSVFFKEDKNNLDINPKISQRNFLDDMYQNYLKSYKRNARKYFHIDLKFLTYIKNGFSNANQLFEFFIRNGDDPKTAKNESKQFAECLIRLKKLKIYVNKKYIEINPKDLVNELKYKLIA